MQNQSKINFQSKIRICTFEILYDLKMKNIYHNKMFSIDLDEFFEIVIKDSDSAESESTPNPNIRSTTTFCYTQRSLYI